MGEDRLFIKDNGHEKADHIAAETNGLKSLRDRIKDYETLGFLIGHLLGIFEAPDSELINFLFVEMAKMGERGDGSSAFANELETHRIENKLKNM